jgi:hypothetical protein
MTDHDCLAIVFEFYIKLHPYDKHKKELALFDSEF